MEISHNFSFIICGWLSEERKCLHSVTWLHYFGFWCCQGTPATSWSCLFGRVNTFYLCLSSFHFPTLMFQLPCMVCDRLMVMVWMELVAVCMVVWMRRSAFKRITTWTIPICWHPWGGGNSFLGNASLSALRKAALLLWHRWYSESP